MGLGSGAYRSRFGEQLKMDYAQFQALSREDVAQLVRDAGPVTGVFALNGTRRWFQLEYGHEGQAVGQAYFEAITDRLIELTALLFDYGVHTLLVPLLSPHLFTSRGQEYTSRTIGALTYLTRTPKFLDFYRQYNIAARFYGDYAGYLVDIGQSALLAEINTFNEAHLDEVRHRLYWGVCAHDSVTTTARLAVELYAATGQIPSNEEMIRTYYGADIPPVSFFIGASKPRAFDTPLLLTGREDLYFTVAPSPYLNELQLRDILYDHLFARRKAHSKYHEMTAADWDALRSFYEQNARQTLGVGMRVHEWGLWQPTNQLEFDRR